jgi:hypothetical protein
MFTEKSFTLYRQKLRRIFCWKRVVKRFFFFCVLVLYAGVAFVALHYYWNIKIWYVCIPIIYSLSFFISSFYFHFRFIWCTIFIDHLKCQSFKPVFGKHPDLNRSVSAGRWLYCGTKRITYVQLPNYSVWKLQHDIKYPIKQPCFAFSLWRRW